MALLQSSRPVALFKYGDPGNWDAAIRTLPAQTAWDQLAEQSRQFDVRAELYKDWINQQQNNGGGLSSMLSAYNQAYNTSKAQNEAKYNQELGIAGRNSGQQRTDVLRNFQQQQANAMQGLNRLGMGNTTVAPTMQMGIQREQQGALNRVADQLTQQKLGIMQGYNFQGPDQGVMQSMISALAPQKTFSF